MPAELTLSERQTRVEAIIKRVLEGMPIKDAIKGYFAGTGDFYDCISSERELAVRFTRAMEMRAELLVDELVTIADSDDDPQRVRNRLDVRKWIASKMLPKKYGERIDLNVTQTIDVSDALKEARARMIRPMHDQLTQQQPQVIDITPVSVSEPRDKESRKAVESNPGSNEEPDIFS